MARRGFTLLEMIVSSMLLSIVLSAATALMFITARTAPADEDPGIVAAETLRALDMLASELGFAHTITAAEAHRVEFIIRDRDAEGVDDIISYQWSGVAGEPLTRTVGNRGAQPVIRSVASLELTYTLSEDATSLISIGVAAHPQKARHALIPLTVRLVNRPSAP